MSSGRIAVLGLGNLMRTDDAVGMLAAQALSREEGLGEGVAVVEGGTLGLDLLHPLRDVTHLLALDAVEAGVAPGTILRFVNDETANLPISKSVHLLGFADLIGAMRLTGRVPWEIVVLGVQPESTGWGTELTSRVQNALPILLQAVREQIELWTDELANQDWLAGRMRAQFQEITAE